MDVDADGVVVDADVDAGSDAVADAVATTGALVDGAASLRAHARKANATEPASRATRVFTNSK